MNMNKTDFGVPWNSLVVNGQQHDEYAYGVEKRIPAQGPPVEICDGRGRQTAHGYDEHDIENGRSDDATDAYIVFGQENADDDRGQFGCRATGCHKSSAGDIGTHLEFYIYKK